jgi:hypothetical protein
MTRHANPWMTMPWDVCRLGVESCAVIALRLEKLALGGPAAQLEAQRMVTEKVVAVVEAHAEAARLVAVGRGGDAPRKVLTAYQRKVSANRRRLAPKR